MHGVPKRDGALCKVKLFWVMLAGVANLVFADALCKRLAVLKLKGVASVPVVDGFFDLCYVENRGCAWGMLQGHTWPLSFFGILALAFLVWKREAVFGRSVLAPVLMYAGIAGNTIDRICYGFVVDFFDFHWYGSHFPCFNLADAFICVAAGLMLLDSFLKPDRKRRNS